MAFCTKCGRPVIDGASYCAACGTAVENKIHMGSTDRKGHFCPGCGSVLDSFIYKCPYCGYELRDEEAVISVKEFTKELIQADGNDKKLLIIRNFPIPNTKEDVMEFLILASTNIVTPQSEILLEAWIVKFEQAYTKAKLIFGEDHSFLKVQEIYDRTQKSIRKIKRRQKLSAFGKTAGRSAPVMPNLMVVITWLASIYILIPLCGINLDNVGFNAYQLLIWVDFIAGIFIIPQVVHCGSFLPGITAVIGVAISIAILIPLCGKNLDNVGFNGYQLIFFVEIVCCIAIVIRTWKR